MDTLNKKDGDYQRKEGECAMCKFVLIFAFVVLLSVLMFTFFFRTKPAPLLEPLAPELVQPLDPDVARQHLLDLERILHPGITYPNSPEVHSQEISTHKTVTTHE